MGPRDEPATITSCKEWPLLFMHVHVSTCTLHEPGGVSTHLQMLLNRYKLHASNVSAHHQLPGVASKTGS